MKNSVTTFVGGQRGLALLVAFAFATGLFWAHARDPFKRVPFSLKTASGKKVECMAVLPKPVATFPVVIWLHGSGGNLTTDGNDLRQLAELGFAAVGVEYDQRDQGGFDEQFVTLNNYLMRQPWARSNAVAWIGFSLGAERTLSFVLRHPEIQPQLYVRLAGGLVPELESRPLTSLHCPVLLVHGENDNIFPVADCRRLAALLRTNGVQAAVRVFAGEQHHFPENRPALMRGIAEYCANFFGTIQPLADNTRPSYWHYWLPVALLAVILAVNWQLRRRASYKSISDPYPKLSRTILVVAWLVGTAAFVETGIHLGLPRLTASETTLGWTRRWLVREPMRGDFDWLVHEPFADGLKINTLLQHLELADLQRKFFYPALDGDMYRRFVLSPLAEAGPVSDFHWRRELWENFYPRIRHETEAASAASIVVRFLRERVTILPGRLDTGGVELIWKQGVTDAAGFEVIYVAALRSVGIAARLNASRQAELWNGKSWQDAPRPLISTWKDLARE